MIVKDNSVIIKLTPEEIEIFKNALNIIESLRDKIDFYDDNNRTWDIVNPIKDIDVMLDLASGINDIF